MPVRRAADDDRYCRETRARAPRERVVCPDRAGSDRAGRGTNEGGRSGGGRGVGVFVPGRFGGGGEETRSF